MELKDELVEIDMSEYHYLDANIIQLKLVPRDFEIFHMEAPHQRRKHEIAYMIDTLIEKCK